jgi:uncharacterized surface protein with fasciclin (FAS1) repeats
MKRRLAAGIAAAALTAGVAAAPAAVATTTAPTTPPTIAGVLLADGDTFDTNWYDFDIVTEAVKATGLAGAAADPSANLTVFAPNDRAFQVFAWSTTGKWLTSEQAIFDALVAKFGAATIKNVLLYHIVPGKISSATALNADGAKLETLLGKTATTKGATFEVDVISKAFKIVQLKDKDPDAINPFLVASKLDIPASNGVIHGISFVLRPLDLPRG